jgi:hypothetical protein
MGPREHRDARVAEEVDYLTRHGANQVVMGEREIGRAMVRMLARPEQENSRPARRAAAGLRG